MHPCEGGADEKGKENGEARTGREMRISNTVLTNPRKELL
jgi:hypothetical protein